MAYTTIDNPELFFQCKLYTGNATDDTAITLDGDENMQPDWVWIKDRTNGNHNRLYDSVRGATKVIYSSLSNAEGTASTGLKSFDSNGFTLGTGSDENGNSANFVSWNWKAGTAFSNDASATSVGTIDSSGSINTDAGISIISFTGTGSAGTIAHGLGKEVDCIAIKNRNDSAQWSFYHRSLGGTKYMAFNSTSAAGTASTQWNNTDPTSSVFSVGTSNNTNDSSDGMIAILFSSIKGYSKFGSYTGNGDADGSFVYTGFKPAFVMTKKTSSSTARNWCILDNKRSSSGANVVDDRLFPNLGDAEDSSTSADFLSNGFKLRDNAGEFNQAVSYIYMAFAEAPFVNSNGVPCNAR
tara:strand:- start:12 stop:1073 length:1062 start_codon:yes stop_codon:yes gene_type:complete